MYVRQGLAGSWEETRAPARPCQRRPGLKGQPAVIHPAFRASRLTFRRVSDDGRCLKSERGACWAHQSPPLSASIFLTSPPPDAAASPWMSERVCAHAHAKMTRWECPPPGASTSSWSKWSRCTPGTAKTGQRRGFGCSVPQSDGVTQPSVGVAKRSSGFGQHSPRLARDEWIHWGAHLERAMKAACC